jgi:choline dehydrogenase-like flavoprotein
MGKNKKNGVVDNNGKVFGTKHLYIADCCIFPISIDNNTGIPAYVTGYNIGLKLCK